METESSRIVDSTAVRDRRTTLTGQQAMVMGPLRDNVRFDRIPTNGNSLNSLATVRLLA
jgi:hypothetical protein